MKTIVRLRGVCLAGIAVLASACSKPNYDELDRALSQARNRPAGKVAELPAWQPVLPLSYSAGGLRNPFHSPLLDVSSQVLNTSAISAPDLSRPRTALEALPLAALRMVGSIRYEGSLWALIEGEGRVFKVATGDYVGQNFGRVTRVERGRVELLESVPNGDGEWRMRPRTMALKNTQ